MSDDMKLGNERTNREVFRLRKSIYGRPWRWMFFAFIAIWLVIVAVSTLGKSTVMDEPPHIAAGMTYWKYFDFRLNPEHPPLIKLLSVLPVYLIDKVPVLYQTNTFYIDSWFKSDQYTFGYYLLFRTGINPTEVVFHARYVPMLIGVLGAFLAFWWGRRLSGSRLGGFLSAVLLCLYPEYAGHTRFVTLDVPTLVGCAGIITMAYQWWLRPNWKSTFGFAIVAALGSMVKLPVSVFAMFTLIALGIMSVTPISPRAGLRNIVVLTVTTIILMYGAAWTGSGFRYELKNPDIEMDVQSEYAPVDGNYGSGGIGSLLTFVAKYRLLPETSLAMINHTRSFSNRNYFFWGEWARVGWYSYFFGTFLLKTSLIMIGVYAAAFLTWILQSRNLKGSRRRFELSRLFLFSFPFIALFVLFVLGRASLGHRYILFIYFPLSIMAGSAMARWWMRRKSGAMLTWVVIGYCSVLFATQYPHYETYFNEVVRTPYRAIKYLNDSNVDWGQDMPLLARQLKDYNITRYNFAYFGSGKPGAYGIYNYRWILPNYPFAVFQDGDAYKPVKEDFSAMSLNGLLAARSVYPGRFERDPDWTDNSVVIFKPESAQ